MKLDTKQQVLLALYMEYQKDLPRMGEVNSEALDIDHEVFCVALEKLQTEGYITGLEVHPSINNKFYNVRLDGIKLTRDGIDYVDSKFGIQKELCAEDKIKYLIKKCGMFGLIALKMFGGEILKTLTGV